MVLKRIKVNKKISLQQAFVFILMGMVFLFPPFIPPARIEDILLLFALYYIIENKNLKIKTNPILISIGFIIVIVVSTLFGYIIKDVKFYIRDFFIIGMILKYALIYGVSYYSFLDKKFDIIIFFKLLTYIGLLSVIIAYLQYYNVLNINEWFTTMYSDNSFRLFFLLREHAARRTWGTHINPNNYALLLSFSIISSFILFIIYKRRLFLLFNIFLITGLLLTNSRTGMVMIFLTILFIFFLLYFTYKRFLIFTLIAVLLMLGAKHLIKNADNPAYNKYAFIMRFKSDQLDLNSRNSLSTRVNRWTDFFTDIKTKPGQLIIGVGTQKADKHKIYLDNQYVSMIKEHGLIGLLLYLSVFFYLLISSIRKVFIYRNKNKEVFTSSVYFSSLLVAFLVFQIAADIIGDLQNMSLLMISIGFYFSVLTKNKNKENEDFNYFNKIS